MRERLEDTISLAVKMEDGVRNQEMQAAGQGKGTNFPLDPPE